MINLFKKNIKSILNSSLYVIINNNIQLNNNSFYKSNYLAKITAINGCDIIQYRAKKIHYLKMLKEAISISKICNFFKIPFIINDYINLTIDVNADGIHIGQNALNIKQTRDILGNKKIIGLTIRTITEANNAPLNLLDYISIGGIFPTTSKMIKTKLININGLKKIINIIKKKKPDIPIIAISGLNKNNISTVIKCGVNSIAVISAISKVKNPGIACKKLKKIIKENSFNEKQYVS